MNTSRIALRAGSSFPTSRRTAPPGRKQENCGVNVTCFSGFHTALDVSIFYHSLYAGFAMLLGASLWTFLRPSRGPWAHVRARTFPCLMRITV